MEILTERVWFRYSYDRVICKFPVVGRQIRIICTARFCENMSKPLFQWTSDHILPEIYGGTIGNRYLDREIRTIMACVSSGMLLSEAIRESGGFEKKLAAGGSLREKRRVTWIKCWSGSREAMNMSQIWR